VKLPSGDDGPLKAVMVFIHGGGFSSGSGTVEFYGPDYFLNEDVVVVTLNYRLGALGKLRKRGCQWHEVTVQLAEPVLQKYARPVTMPEYEGSGGYRDNMTEFVKKHTERSCSISGPLVITSFILIAILRKVCVYTENP
jgi:hypothetical protein